MKADVDGFVGRSAVRVSEALRDAVFTRSGWWVMPCPFCQERVGTPDKHKKLGVNSETSIWHCFRCGAKGALKPREADDLKQRAKEREPKGPKEDPTRAPEGFYLLGEGDGADSIALAPAREYLASRGVPERVVREARIGACARGKYAERIVVPVLAPDSDAWVGFVARTWGDAEVKYLNAGGAWKGGVIYNGRALAEVTEVPAITVEGSFDTFPFWPDGVALLGEASEEQIQMLVRARRPIAVVLDGDAWRKGVALAQRLQLEGQRAGAVILPPCTDPDQVPRRALREAAWECLETGVVTL